MTDNGYTKQDKETLRVLKMQETDLQRLQEKTSSQREALGKMNERLEKLKARAKGLADENGVELPTEDHHPAPLETERERMPLSDVPSWESILKRTKSEVKGDVLIEDLLSQQEIKLAKSEVERINTEFALHTGLTKGDLAFLATATSIQCARWMMMPKMIGAIGKTARLLSTLAPSTMALLEQRQNTSHEVALIDEVNHEFQEEAESAAEAIHDGHKTWEEILEDGAASDVTEKPFENDALNWLFGIINNITGTHTNGDFTTIDNVTGEAIKTPGIFADAFQSIKEDPMRLPAAVYAKYAQDKAAAGEEVDLLEPLTESFSPEMLGDLYTSQFAQLTAIQELTLVGQQAAVPLVINMAVGLLHGFLYNPAKDGPREFYDARTRKILLLSNAFAAATNLALTAGSENWAKLDVGGLIVSAIRITQDASYIANLEDRFIRNEFDKRLLDTLHDIDRHFLNLPVSVENQLTSGSVVFPQETPNGEIEPFLQTEQRPG